VEGHLEIDPILDMTIQKNNNNKGVRKEKRKVTQSWKDCADFKGNIPTSSLPDETHSEDWEGYSKERNRKREQEECFAYQGPGNDATLIERAKEIPSVSKCWPVLVAL
jgi:hypothetical protein